MSKQLINRDELELQLQAEVMPKIKTLLDGATVGRFLRVAHSYISGDKKIAACSRESQFKALLKCAETGMMPNGEDAALVPYGTNATFMPMKAGYVRSLMSTDKYDFVDAFAVYEKDFFTFYIDSDKGKYFKYEPCLDNVRGEIKGGFAFAKDKRGFYRLEWMNKEQLDRRKNAAETKNVWNKWPERMVEKTVIKALCKKMLTEIPPKLNLAIKMEDSAAATKLPQENKKFEKAIDAEAVEKEVI